VIAVGIDTHKESLAVCVVDDLGRMLGELQVANSRRGFYRVQRYLDSLPKPRCVGIEGSGGCGAPLAYALTSRGEHVVEVPAHLTARRRKHLARPGKSDAGDALAIARVVASEPDLPQANRAGLAADLKALCVYRAQLLGERTRQTNRLHADLVLLCPGYSSQLPAFDSGARQRQAGDLLAALGGVRARLAERRLARIASLDDEIGALERQIGALVRASGTRLTEIRGVGELTAARLLGETGDVRRFRSAAAFAMAAGVAPIPASSGKTQRQRLNRGGNRQLNFALFTAALVQSRCDPRGRDYLERKRAEGKSWKEAIRCLKRQLANVVYRQMVADLE
jgi:transposase